MEAPIGGPEEPAPDPPIPGHRLGTHARIRGPFAPLLPLLLRLERNAVRLLIDPAEARQESLPLAAPAHLDEEVQIRRVRLPVRMELKVAPLDRLVVVAEH